MIQWQTLGQSLERAMSDGENRQLARSILGTDRAEQIGSLLHSFCHAHFGRTIAQCGLTYLSVGATFVVVLEDQAAPNPLVIKAYGRDKNLAALQTSAQIQMTLAQDRFPCPAILTSPQFWRSIILSAQTYVDGDNRVNGFAPPVRRAMARCLADLIQRTQRYDQTALELPLWMPWLEDQSRPFPLWPTPHNILFDFEQTSTGAEWIDEIAHAAQQVLLSANDEPVIGHSDWSVQNMAFRGHELVCVYDWDSLRIGSEPCIVGGAARCFAHDWRSEGPERSITLAEALAFVHEYEAARGKPFTLEEWKSLGAAIVYTAAYGARCAHPGDRPETEHSQRTKQQLMIFASYFLSENF